LSLIPFPHPPPLPDHCGARLQYTRVFTTLRALLAAKVPPTQAGAPLLREALANAANIHDLYNIIGNPIVYA
jgi:hypothetical protein